MFAFTILNDMTSLVVGIIKNLIKPMLCYAQQLQPITVTSFVYELFETAFSLDNYKMGTRISYQPFKAFHDRN